MVNGLFVLRVSAIPVVWARNHSSAVERCSGSLWARSTASRLLCRDCRVPEQTGDTWCVLQHSYKPVQNTNRASERIPSRRRGTDPATHLCCTLMEEQSLSLPSPVGGKRETCCLNREMKRSCCCCWVTDPKVRRKNIEWWNNWGWKTSLRW